MELSGRRALITGGGRGIGKSIALALSDAGASVVVSARSVDEIEAVADEISARGGTAYAVPCDVSDPTAIEGMVNRASELLGGIDILVNNAGVAPSDPVKRITLDDWNHTIQVNVTSTFLCTQAVLAPMIAAEWGRIINVASIAGLRGGAYIAAYSTSKHAQIGFTRSLAVEVAGSGVTVNAICPGYVDTPMTNASIARIVEKTGITEEAALASILALNPQKRLVRPEEVAHAALMLCDTNADSITGQTIVVDGGQDARA